MQDWITEAEVFRIEIVVEIGHIIMVTSRVTDFFENQGWRHDTFRGPTDVAGGRQTGFNIAFCTVANMRRLAEIARGATPGIICRQRRGGRICRIGDQGWAN